MKGFAKLELLFVTIVTVAIAVGGYLLYDSGPAKHELAQSHYTEAEQSRATELIKAVPAAPAVKDTSDLDGLLQSINQLDLEAGNNEANQLDIDL